MTAASGSTYAAIENLSRYARSHRESALGIIRNILQMSDISASRFNVAMQAVARHGRIALHFHPDRFDSRGITVAEGLLQDGFYRNQYETQISSGQLAPDVNGPRDVWERSFFGELGGNLSMRPKYGALDLLHAPNGPAPRFGSCYFLTKPEVMSRASFCFHDSYRSPKDKGTSDAFEMVIAALLSESFERRYALGEYGLCPTRLVERLISALGEPTAARFGRPLSGNLDHYIEAQVHGAVSLEEDIQDMVLDPCFIGTEIGGLFEKIAERYDIRLHWHSGLRLPVADVVTDFRGPSMPSLAERVAIDGELTAFAIGAAAREVSRFPSRWRARGSQGEVLNELKWLWQLLVRYGATTDFGAGTAPCEDDAEPQFITESHSADEPESLMS